MNKETIKSALSAIPTGDFLEKSKDLLSTLGYRSERTLELSGTVHDFLQEFPPLNPNTRTEREFRKHAESVNSYSSLRAMKSLMIFSRASLSQTVSTKET